MLPRSAVCGRLAGGSVLHHRRHRAAPLRLQLAQQHVEGPQGAAPTAKSRGCALSCTHQNFAIHRRMQPAPPMLPSPWWHTRRLQIALRGIMTFTAALQILCATFGISCDRQGSHVLMIQGSHGPMIQECLSGTQMEAEKAFVEWLAKEGRVVVHETTCYGVRECGGSSTFDASCHWNSSGRYVCLRCILPCRNQYPTCSHLPKITL